MEGLASPHTIADRRVRVISGRCGAAQVSDAVCSRHDYLVCKPQEQAVSNNPGTL